jgi:WD40 repeat protein/uncharacterized caspase-like protein
MPVAVNEDAGHRAAGRVHRRNALLAFFIRAFVLLAFVQSASAQTASLVPEIVPQLGQAVVRSVAISPDRRLIVSGSPDRSIVLWDAESGRELRTLKGHTNEINAVLFSPDGKQVVSASWDQTIRLWDVESGQELRAFKGHTNGVSCIAISKDGSRIVSGSADNTIRLWDTASGRELRSFKGHAYNINSVAFSPDGKRVVSGSYEKRMTIWDTETGRELHTSVGHADQINSVGFSPDGRRVVTGSDDKTLKLWDADSGREMRSFKGHTDRVVSVAFSPDGRRILSGSSDKSVKLWDADTGNELHTLSDHTGIVFSVTFSADGRWIVSGSVDGTIRLWDSETAREFRTLVGHTSRVGSVAFSPDGARIVSTSWDNTVKLWETATGRELRIFAGHTDWVYSAAFSSDGQRIVSGSTDHTVKLWDSQSGRELRTFKGHADYIVSVAFSPDNRYVLSGGGDKTLKLWDVDSGRELRTFSGHTTAVSSVAFLPDGHRIASTSLDHTVKLWNVETGRALLTLKGHTDSVWSLAVSPDGRMIASGGSTDHAIKLWDADSGRELRALMGHAGYINSLAFSPDGRRLVSAGDDATIRLWDIESGREIRVFGGNSNSITSVGFSPGGRMIVSGGEDGTVKLWDVDSGALFGTAMSFADGEWVFLTPEGFFDTSSPKGAQNLSFVRGLEVSSVDQVYNALYRPDLVREKLAGDPDGKVKAAAARLDLNKVMASGAAPKVAITSPMAGSSADKDEVAVDATVSDQGGGVGKVEWRVNGVTLGIETRGLARVAADVASGPGKPLTVRRSLALERGENRIEVLAYNAKELIASEPASVTVNWDGEKGATPPKLFVMAVGVNDYFDSRLKLSYAVPDATAIAEGFRKAGTGLYAGVDVTTVLDSDVTISNLDKVFTEIGSRVQPRDVFVFFLAGHGKTKNGRYYFLPRDFRYEDEDSIEKAGMDQDKFQAWFAKIPARKSILLYDTCESGSLTGNKIRGSDIDERLGALNRMTRATGRTFLTATTDDAPALEGYHGHGVFTYAILDALDHGDVNKNGLIEVSELADYVDRKVPDISFDAFKLRQIPQRSIVGNNFALTNQTDVLATAGAAPTGNGEENQSSVAKNAMPGADTVIPTKSTHVVILPVTVKSGIDPTAAVVAQLPAGSQVRVIETDNGWVLIARNGQKIGYVEEKDLLALQ